MPVEVFWEVNELVKRADYLVSANEEPGSVKEIYVKIFQKCAPFAVQEKDRTWLYERAQGG